MAVVDINEDCQAAVKTLWQATVGLGQPDPAAGNFYVGELRTGRFVAGTGLRADATGASQIVPYAYVEVTKEGAAENERVSNGAEHDYRFVRLAVRGLRSDIVKAQSYLLATFSKRLQPTFGGADATALTLKMPSGAAFVAWRKSNYADRKIEDSQKQGNEIWEAHLTGEVWTTRYDS